jgi:RimJ/RimL family protein N-acetyltransferase
VRGRNGRSRAAHVFKRSFQFLDPGLLRDGELQLVAPHERFVDALLAAANNPLTLAMEPHEPRLARQQILDYLAALPGGRVPGDASAGRVPHYDFWMLLHDAPREPGGPVLPPPVRIAGTITLRVGSTPALEAYYGHVGYHVYPPARGHHYAERSCRLLLDLMRRHAMATLWITCDPQNIASRRTCERLGMEYVQTVRVPPSDPLYARGEREKCRYRLAL